MWAKVKSGTVNVALLDSVLGTDEEDGVLFFSLVRCDLGKNVLYSAPWRNVQAKRNAASRSAFVNARVLRVKKPIYGNSSDAWALFFTVNHSNCWLKDWVSIPKETASPCGDIHMKP